MVERLCHNADGVGGGLPNQPGPLPQTRSIRLDRESAGAVMQEWVGELIGKQVMTGLVFFKAGLRVPEELPQTVEFVSLYTKPNIQRVGDAVVHTIAMGLTRTRWDPEVSGLTQYWMFSEPPEVKEPAGVDYVLTDDVTLSWKIHVVFPGKDGPFLAVNPIGNIAVKLDSQNETQIRAALDDRLRELNGENPPDANKIRKYLDAAITKTDSPGPMIMHFRYPQRDRIAAAMAINAGLEWGLDRMAFPSEETLRRRWPRITPGKVRRYRELEEFTITNSTGRIMLFEFNPDLSLRPLGGQ